MDERWRAALALLPDYLAWHVVLSASALGLGLLIGLPLALAARRNAPLRTAALGLAGLVQTIPSIALLALFFPILLGLGAVSRAVFGVGFSALGFLPSLLALSLYSVLPILRNGIAGLTGVQAGLGEAARSLGLSRLQALGLVELPAAAPVIMAGVRTAAVWVVGSATLSTPVGQTSLGNFIFSGLQTENWVSVIVGCVAAAVLALSVDALLALIERGARQGNARVMGVGLGGLLLGVAVAAAPLVLPATAPAYTLGAKNFSEQYILADLMADRIAAAGGRSRQKDDLGSAVAFRAVAAGEIDAYVDYSGTLWTNVLKRTDTPPRAQLLAELTAELRRRYGVRVLGPLGFENAYALVMRADRAKALRVKTVDDLARAAPKLTFGSDLEFLSRPEWAALQTAYGLDFKAKRSYQPTFMYRALESGDVDVISAFSSDGRIAAEHLAVLDDPRRAIPPYDAILLLSPRRANDGRLVAALSPLVGAVPVEAMRRANYAVDGRSQSPQAAARALEAEIAPLTNRRPSSAGRR